MGISKLNQLAQAFQLKKIVRRCNRTVSVRKVALLLKKESYLNLGCDKATPSDVPKGHIPVYVGSHRRRFIIPATHLNHPLFRLLLDKAEEEFGFDHDMGLHIPWGEAAFEGVISLLNGRKSIRLIELTPGIDLESLVV